MHLAVIYHPDCAKHVAGKRHPESPQRMLAPLAALKASPLSTEIDFYTATQATTRHLKRAHDSEYIDALYECAPKEGYHKIDKDTQMNPFSLDAALYAAGAQINAVDLIMKKQAQRVYCHVRPPGHHATAKQSMGFCFLNNVPVGALYAAYQYKLKVAVIDFDAHHGNGSEAIFRGRDDVLFCSSYQQGIFPRFKIEKADNLIFTPLPRGCSSETFRKRVSQQWFKRIKDFKPDLIYISAGFDAHEAEDIAGLKLQDDDFTWITNQASMLANELCQGRIISSLEGGYNLDVLTKNIVNHVQTLKDGVYPMPLTAYKSLIFNGPTLEAKKPTTASKDKPKRLISR